MGMEHCTNRLVNSQASSPLQTAVSMQGVVTEVGLAGLWNFGLALALVTLNPGTAFALSQTAPISGQVLQTPLKDLKDFDYWRGLCDMQIEAGHYSEARSACEAAIALRPQDAELWTVHSSLLLNLAQYAEVLISAQQALALKPENSLALLNQCRAYLELNQPGKAITTCQQAVEVNQNWGDQSAATAWLYQGRALQPEDYGAALVAYERALLINRENSQVLTYRCEAYFALGQYDNALASCQSAIRGNGDWGTVSPALAWYYQGLAYQEQKQYAAAVDAFDTSLRLNDGDVHTWFAQGKVLELWGRDEAALLSYKRAVALQPNWSIALVGLCTVLNKTVQYEAALEACEQALAGDGDWEEVGPAQAWSQQAQALTGLGQYQEALAALDRAVGLAPDYADAWNNRGAVLAYLNQWQLAIASLQRAAELDPISASPWVNLGRIQRMLGQYSNAIAAYDHALELNPSDAEAWANRSVVQWYLQQYDAALASADRAIALNDKSYLGWYNRATTLVSLERYPDAGRAYQQAIRLEPESADAWTGLGLVLTRLNRYDEARRVLAKALELNPQHEVALSTWQSLPPFRPSR